MERAGPPSQRCPHIGVIGCAVLRQEISHLAEDKSEIARVVFLPQGLHNEPDRLRRELQSAIDTMEAQHPEVETIVLGYGLCSRGSEGVMTSRCRLVIAKAHDCITHLLGCRHRYRRYVADHPGTYWFSPGWIRSHLPPGPDRYQALLDEYTEQYGADDAAYLMEMEQSWFNSYSRAAYVAFNFSCSSEEVEYTRSCAEWLGWSVDHQPGDPALLADLLSGVWDEERYVVIDPGEAFGMSGDDDVIERTDRNQQIRPTCFESR